MPKIEDNGTVKNTYKPPVEPKKVEPAKVEPAKTAPTINPTTRLGETQNLGVSQKLLLNQKLDRDNSLLIGGTAGSTGGQFSLGETNVRGAGQIKITNTELSYNYSTNQFIKNPNANTADFVTKVTADLNRIA